MPRVLLTNEARKLCTLKQSEDNRGSVKVLTFMGLIYKPILINIVYCFEILSLF